MKETRDYKLAIHKPDEHPVWYNLNNHTSEEIEQVANKVLDCILHKTPFFIVSLDEEDAPVNIVSDLPKNMSDYKFIGYVTEVIRFELFKVPGQESSVKTKPSLGPGLTLIQGGLDSDEDDDGKEPA